MTISSRTPEGIPHRCPVCGKTANLEPSFPGDDSCCPTCGKLLWRFRDQVLGKAFALPTEIKLTSSFVNDLGYSSLETVELVMEMEEHFDLVISDEAAEQIKTVADFIRFIRKQQPDEDD